jgi:excisionase family DNA binding protein
MNVRLTLSADAVQSLLTARQVAPLLGLSARKVYALAAAGEIACHRFGASVRFDPSDLDNYKAACRSPATTRAAGSTSLTASLPEAASGLTAYFRKAGRAPKPKPSTSEKRRGSTNLQLVATGPSP